jgi:hypothetical protein
MSRAARLAVFLSVPQALLKIKTVPIKEAVALDFIDMVFLMKRFSRY